MLSLPPAKRTLELPERMRAVRTELAQPILRHSAQARDLDARIEEWDSEAVTTGLRALPGATG